MSTSNPPPSRKGACAIYYDDEIYYIGGRSPSKTDLCTYVISLESNSWVRKSASPFDLSGFAYARKDSIVYIHGGENVRNQNDLLFYKKKLLSIITKRKKSSDVDIQ